MSSTVNSIPIHTVTSAGPMPCYTITNSACFFFCAAAHRATTRHARARACAGSVHANGAGPVRRRIRPVPQRRGRVGVATESGHGDAEMALHPCHSQACYRRTRHESRRGGVMDMVAGMLMHHCSQNGEARHPFNGPYWKGMI